MSNHIFPDKNSEYVKNSKIDFDLGKTSYCYKSYKNAFIKGETYKISNAYKGIDVSMKKGVTTYFRTETTYTDGYEVIWSDRTFEDYFILTKDLREEKLKRILNDK